MEKEKILLNAEDRPTMKELQDVMRIKDVDVTTQWRNLGLELLGSNKVLKEIETDHRNDVITCCRVMFEKWLEMKSDASWDHLVTALKNIQMNTSANAISKLFKSGNAEKNKSSLIAKIRTPAEASFEFGILMREIIKELKKNEDDNLEIIKDLCPYLTAKDDEKVSLFSTDELKAIDVCSDIRRMFKENLRECWRWDDFSFLNKIIRYINSSVCKSLLDKYQQSLCYKMKLKEICEHYKQAKKDLPDGYSAMFAIVEKNFVEITLKEYLELKNFTSRYCGVDPMFMSPFVSAGPYSSIMFEWFIPLTAISYMVKVATSNADIFIQEGFVLLKISSAMIFDRRADENWSPLYYATKYGQATVVEALLKSASVEMINRWGTLHTAARYGHVPVVDSIIKLGADVNTISMENWTPLLTAARNNQVAVIETLIKSGADVNGGNLNKWTPLHAAARHGHAEVAEILIQAGAKMNVGTMNKWTPLHTAARQGHVTVVKTMIDLGADADYFDSNNLTPLHCAAEQGHVVVVEVLTDSGANVNALTNDGWSPLHFAAYYNRIQVVRCLIKSRANVCVTTKDEKYSPLHLAALNGHVEAVETLLKLGADIDAITLETHSALHIAARNGKSSVVQALIASGANINACDKNLNTPLHLATKNDHVNVVEILGKARADVSIVNKNQRTALHIAVYRDNVSLVKELIKFGADVNATIGSRTLLEEAVRCREKNVVIYFIEELLINMDITSLDRQSQAWMNNLLQEQQIRLQRRPATCSFM